MANPSDASSASSRELPPSANRDHDDEDTEDMQVALTIAGSDSGGGAGIQADLKTFTALGVFGTSVLTALTAQNTCGVTGVMLVAPDFIRQQMDAVCDDFPIRAIKTGMLATPEIISAVVSGLKVLMRTHPGCVLVADPVAVTRSGERLLAPEAIRTLIDELFPLATVITPNRFEAALFGNSPPIRDIADLEAAAHRLWDLTGRPIYLKGGHGFPDAIDLLRDENGLARFTLPDCPVITRHTHGTGCTLSAAVAAYLARGFPLRTALSLAKIYVTEAIRRAPLLGKGHGPIRHDWALPKPEC